MPELNKVHFRGVSEIPAGRKAELVTGSSEKDIENTLTKLGWEGNLIATVSLKVTADGQRVHSGQFMMRGALSAETIQLQASKLWEGADAETVLCVNIPTGAELRFEGGRLCSEYIAQEAVKYEFKKAGITLSKEEQKASGTGEFSMRVLAHLGKTSNGTAGPHIKFTVLTFPLSVDALTELTAATQSPSWPGIKTLEGQCKMFPAAPEGLWGAPCFPLLNTEQRAATSSDLPAADQLRYALADVMRTAARPTACVSIGGLKKFSTMLTRDQEAAEPNEPTIIWPNVARPETTRDMREREESMSESEEDEIESSDEYNSSRLSGARGGGGGSRGEEMSRKR